MSSFTFTPSHRTLKPHEWLTLLMLLLICNGVRATTVYKCTDASGGVSYQSGACVASQRATEIELAPVPPAAPSPQYALQPFRPAAPQRRDLRVARAKTETAFECRTSGGDVFYRLGHCPRSIGETSGGRHAGAAKQASTVSSRPVPRATACSEMRRAGSAGRKGHEYDEPISSYDRNLGNDPCK